MQTELRTAPVAASILMVAAMAIIGVIDNFVVRVAETIGLWQFHFVRALVMLPLIGGLSLLGLGHMRPIRPGVVALRSFLMALAMLFYFSALAFMPIAQALAGLFTSPIFVLLISALGMGQRIGPWRILAVLTGFAGILFVLQPDPGAFDFMVLVPVAGGLFYAMSVIVTRSYCAGESTVVLLGGLALALGGAGALGLLGFTIFPVDPETGPAGFVTRGWVWPMTEAIPWVLVQACGASVAVFMLIKAYQLGEPSYVAVFEYSIMIFGPLFAWVAFGQTLGAYQIVGVALIATAGIIIALRSG